MKSPIPPTPPFPVSVSVPLHLQKSSSRKIHASFIMGIEHCVLVFIELL